MSQQAWREINWHGAAYEYNHARISAALRDKIDELGQGQTPLGYRLVGAAIGVSEWTVRRFMQEGHVSPKTLHGLIQLLGFERRNVLQPATTDPELARAM